MSSLSPEDHQKQLQYRDARFIGTYDSIWQSVGKCVFCDLKEKYIFFEENGVVMTISLFAYIDGHFMIIPRRHIRAVKELTDTEWETIRKFTYIAKRLIKKVHGIKGMQLIQKDGATAQSTVDQHLHFHCVPFDAPDLLEWHYRKLQYTPLENVALYKKARSTIIESGMKFSKKYHLPQALPVVCDLVIVNAEHKVLLQERKAAAKLVPDALTLPGGTVEDFSKPLELELAREVKEETGLAITPTDVTLLASRISTISHTKQEPHLKARYLSERRFVWNTYRLKQFKESARLTPGDDCEALIWLSKKEVASHPKLGAGLRDFLLEQL